MPVPVPKHLSLFLSLSYITERAGDRPLVRAGFYEALRNGYLVPEGEIPPPEKPLPWHRHKLKTPIPPEPLASGPQLIPLEYWRQYTINDLDEKIGLLDTIKFERKDGIIIRYNNVNLATAAIDAWLERSTVGNNEKNSTRKEKAVERWRSAKRAVDELRNGKLKLSQEAALHRLFRDKHDSVQKINNVESYKSAYLRNAKKYPT